MGSVAALEALAPPTCDVPTTMVMSGPKVCWKSAGGDEALFRTVIWAVAVPARSRTATAAVRREVMTTWLQLEEAKDGFHPDQEPRYPQKHAEIMALGIPVRAGVDEPVLDLQDCVVGEKTAAEMNWVRD